VVVPGWNKTVAPIPLLGDFRRRSAGPREPARYCCVEDVWRWGIMGFRTYMVSHSERGWAAPDVLWFFHRSLWLRSHHAVPRGQVPKHLTAHVSVVVRKMATRG
jgi:hypothetical protein